LINTPLVQAPVQSPPFPARLVQAWPVMSGAGLQTLTAPLSIRGVGLPIL
jgi:hypothetical protein